MKNCSWNFTIEAGGPRPFRKQPTRTITSLLLCVLVASGLLWGCHEPPEASRPVDYLGPFTAYVFQPDSQHYLTAPQPFPLAPEGSVTGALEALGAHLSRHYFSSGTADARISFEIMSVHSIPVGHRNYRLAVVNLVDPDGDALQVFFQGSAGGQTTFYMLAAAFLQAHHAPPLVDGIILLYNGETFPEADHVNFRGIVTPEMIRPVVMQAMFRHQRSDSALPE
jgi:hypothetical protein